MNTSTEVLDPLAAFNLKGKVVVITGASSGLGARFAQVVASLSRAEAVACDVGEPGANERLVEHAVEAHGRVDVVVANAGISNAVPAAKETVDDYRHVVDIDLVAPFALAKAAYGPMREQQSGSIIMIASAAGLGSLAIMPQASYAAAKTGLIGLASSACNGLATGFGSMRCAQACSRPR